MAQQMTDFHFPTYGEMTERNQAFLDAHKYKGYQVKMHVSENLYLLIDCQNNSQVFKDVNNTDLMRFAWCTDNEFAIFSKLYVNCEAGYIQGCADLVNAANAFHKGLEQFSHQHARVIRHRIDDYNKRHPDEEGDSND